MSSDTTAPAKGARPRLDSLDLLRGIVMVIMALDHARGFFSTSMLNGKKIDPELIPNVDAALFFTRWVTHFCAPVLVFLAGTSAFLYQARGRSRNEVTAFLLKRGVWLILLEWTVVRAGWLFGLEYGPTTTLGLGVIYAIGACMLVLALLIRLPLGAVAAIGITMIVGHNLTDTSSWQLAMAEGSSADWTVGEKLWAVLHVGLSKFRIEGLTGIRVRYPLIPWIGVMATGYAFGALVRLPEPRRRRRTLLCLGTGLSMLFIALRAINLYGDPRPWTSGPSAMDTVIAFLNTQKYPPSLMFLTMTLGPSIVFIALAGPARSWIAKTLVTIGRVPLFFYVVHLYLLHALAGLWGLSRFGREALTWGPGNRPPPEYDLGLWPVYAAWALCILLIYPACKWFAGIKQRNKHPLLSYL